MESPKEYEQSPVSTPWAGTPDEVLRALDGGESGLNARLVDKRRRQYGPNTIKGKRTRSTWRIFVEQAKNLIAALLAAAALLSFSFGQWLDGASVLVALALNVLIGFFYRIACGPIHGSALSAGAYQEHGPAGWSGEKH